MIEKLEEKDFGTIFGALFLDHGYVNHVKGFVSGNKKTFIRPLLGIIPFCSVCGKMNLPHGKEFLHPTVSTF